MDNYKNLKSNHNKFVAQGFFLVGAMSIADPSTILPIIVHYFSGSNVLVGLFSSLLRGGAILMQLYVAFNAQTYTKVLGHLKVVFVFRFLSWFLIGVFIYFLSSISPVLTLIFFGLGLFIFSFSAGYGVIYYQELIGKAFTKEFRGKAMANRQLAAGFAGILSGGVSGFILSYFEAPYSYSYLFFISGIIMGVGFLIMSTFKEGVKEVVSKKEKSFLLFIKNSFSLLKYDKYLRFQIITRLFSYSFWFIFPFIILEAKEKINIEGTDIGLILALQMAGAMLSNLIWGKLSYINRNRLIIFISFILIILSVGLAIISNHIIYYYILFFLSGAGIDGFRLAYSNLILIISPDIKRPVYVAVQNNITSVGLFFSIPGGFLLNIIGFQYLAIMVICLLIIGFIISFKLKCI